MAMATQDSRMPKYNFENFHVWQLRTECILALNDVWEVVSGEETEPDASDVVAVKDYKKRDSKARALVLQTVQDCHLYMVRQSKSAKEAWDTLCREYAVWALANRFSLQGKLLDLKMREGEDIHSHINYFDICEQHVAMNSLPLEESEKAMILVGSMPDSYQSVMEELKDEFCSAGSLSFAYTRLRLVLASYDLPHAQDSRDSSRGLDFAVNQHSGDSSSGFGSVAKKKGKSRR